MEQPKSPVEFLLEKLPNAKPEDVPELLEKARILELLRDADLYRQGYMAGKEKAQQMFY